MIDPENIVAVLGRYAGRYRYLDVLAADVRLNSAPTRLQVERLPNGVLRFSLLSAEAGPVGPMVAGAVIGAAMGSKSTDEGGVLAGMLLGMLVGAVAGSSAPLMNRVMALRFEPSEGRWNIYDGPLLNLAKSRLVPISVP